MKLKNKKIMSKVDVLSTILFGGLSLLSEIIIIIDKEETLDAKFICSCILGVICLISSIVLLIDLKRRIEFDKGKLSKETKKTVDYDVWNASQLQYEAKDREFYDKTIDDALGEKRTFFQKSDKYGNTTLEHRNDNLLDSILVLLLSSMFLIVPIIQMMITKNYFEFGSIIVLLIGIALFISSINNIKRIKKMGNKISTFQYIKFLFMFLIFIFVFIGIVIGLLLKNTNLLTNIDIEKIIKTIFILAITVGGIAFIYQIILVFYAKAKECKSIKNEGEDNE